MNSLIMISLLNFLPELVLWNASSILFRGELFRSDIFLEVSADASRLRLDSSLV